VTLRRCRDSIFSGNILQDCQTGRHQFPEAPELQRRGLLELEDCRNVTISHSQILDSAPTGIWLNNCQDMILMGLSVEDRREPPLQRHAIEWQGVAGRSLITACRFSGCTEVPVVAAVQPTGCV
jgi:polygalacturonase